ncbi:MAG TPA: nucleoside triphosphate pyrophosphohydrolase [Blastocatellia bacterium]|jgi:MazG family protein|nr:nucleoside triphosphate pyrophosphohydrolase [Blastocatellia bacterium]
MDEKRTFQDLIDMMARLRATDGCPWDREQTYATLGPMLIEEAYEVIEAAEAEDWSDLRDELGDLLFQIVFYGQIGVEKGHFDLHQSIARVHEKMTRRHPHVFGEEKGAVSTADVLANWEAIKATERKVSGKEGGKEGEKSLLDGVSLKLPALLEALQLTTKAARVGFDWKKVDDVLLKLEEEIRELREEVAREGVSNEAVAGEIGDILFVVANLARWNGVEPESALKATNRKFRRRFKHVEKRIAEQGRAWSEVSLEEMDGYWDEAKRIERSSKD